MIVAAAVSGSASQFSVDLSDLGLPFGTREVCADFTDAVGLYEGNNVSMLGVTVGKVEEIKQLERAVRVTMTIPSDLELPADVGATTVSTSIVTDRRVEFSKPYTDGPAFDGSSCITKTKTPKGISDVLDGINSTAADILGSTRAESEDGKRQVAEFIENIDRIVGGSGSQANLALAAISQVIGDPAEKDALARRLVDNSAELTSMFVTNWPDFEKVLSRLSAVADLISGSTNGLGSAIAYANDFLPVLARNIAKYDEQAYGVLDVYVPRAHELLSRAGDLKEILAYLPILIRKAPGIFDPVRNALLLTYRSPAFLVSAGGRQVSMNMADLLEATKGGRR
ncbi:MlaD family protein [Gordonia malaquae]|uniref:MlaD family protein n=1 Tax=Gordonia malaquae TaxID=410332 RepID=UPI0030FF333E